MINKLPTYFDFSNSGHVKLALLSQGVHISTRGVFENSIFSENQFPYGYSNLEIKKYSKIPAEFILPNDVYCGLQLCPSSPWSIQILDKGFGLFYGKRFVFTVSFVPRPRFYGTYLSDGKTLCEKVGVLYGSKYILSFFTRGYCYFFSINKQCKFCSLNPTRKSIGKDNILFITPSLAQELTKIAFASNPDIQYVNHCSGTHQNNDLGLKFQIDVLRAVVSETPMGVKQHMLTMPPNNLGMLKDLKDAGLGTINFALEVFDPEKFRLICEGKNTLYGRSRFFDAYKEAVCVFGKGNSYVNFVGGLESLNTMTQGFWELGEMGVAASVNVFHPDPSSIFAKKSPPQINYLFDMVHAQNSVYKKYDFRPIFPNGGTRNSLDTEVTQGFFSYDK